jgi:hypothetical protein
LAVHLQALEAVTADLLRGISLAAPTTLAWAAAALADILVLLATAECVAVMVAAVTAAVSMALLAAARQAHIESELAAAAVVLLAAVLVLHLTLPQLAAEVLV